MACFCFDLFFLNLIEFVLCYLHTYHAFWTVTLTIASLPTASLPISTSLQLLFHIIFHKNSHIFNQHILCQISLRHLKQNEVLDTSCPPLMLYKLNMSGCLSQDISCWAMWRATRWEKPLLQGEMFRDDLQSGVCDWLPHSENKDHPLQASTG